MLPSKKIKAKIDNYLLNGRLMKIPKKDKNVKPQKKSYKVRGVRALTLRINNFFKGLFMLF